MDIKEIFLYFAKFPLEDGVKAAFRNGTSEFAEYQSLMNEYQSGDKAILPDISNYVFGQDFDAVKAIIDGMNGNYLFVEIGEVDSNENEKGSIEDNMKVACTIAFKNKDNIDLVDRMIISDRCLSLINSLRYHLRRDQEPWLRMMDSTTQLQPFVSSEFNSVGWTFMFNLKGYIFDIK